MAGYKLNSLIAVLLSGFLLLSSCNNNSDKKIKSASGASIEWSELPEVIKLTQFKTTEFLPTLENPLGENKNSIYAAAFLYAWDSLRTIYKSPIQLSDSNSNDMKLVNQSTSFRNTLKRNEYSIKAYQEDYLVYIEAFFNKTLPFPKKLDKSDKPILFDKHKISAFGMNTFDYDIAEFCTIPFYADDNRFILKLAPTEKDHEIFLVKGLKNIKTFADAVLQVKKMIEQGEKEKQDELKSWRYSLNEGDIFSIPAIKYNIETNYKSLEEQTFTTENRNPSIVIAYQRTGFILNENGAVVESKAIVTTTDTSFVSIEKSRPKKMIFDRPFFIMMKRKEQPNPYFMMKVENAELLSKE